MLAPGPEELDISLVQTIEVHSNNLMDFGEHCKGSSVAARAIGILGGISRSNDLEHSRWQ